MQTKEQAGDIHGFAQTYNNLGNVYADKGEWDQVIELYQHSLQTLEQVGDIHSFAYTNAALGQLCQARGNIDHAARRTAQAWLIFAQMKAEYDLERTGRQLVDILGSVEAAQTYVEQMLQQMEEDEAES